MTPPYEANPPILRRVLAVVDKADDLEVHLCVATLAGVTVLDVREYVPSLAAYGRGTTMPWNTETLKRLRTGLRTTGTVPDA